MRYQLFDDDLGNYLVVDTWKSWVLAKAPNLKLGARICQKLNKRLGSDECFSEFVQKYLTSST